MSILNKSFWREPIPMAEALERGKVRFSKQDVLSYYNPKQKESIRTPLPRDRKRWEESF